VLARLVSLLPTPCQFAAEVGDTPKTSRPTNPATLSNTDASNGDWSNRSCLVSGRTLIVSVQLGELGGTPPTDRKSAVKLGRVRVSVLQSRELRADAIRLRPVGGFYIEQIVGLPVFGSSVSTRQEQAVKRKDPGLLGSFRAIYGSEATGGFEPPNEGFADFFPRASQKAQVTRKRLPDASKGVMVKKVSPLLTSFNKLVRHYKKTK